MKKNLKICVEQPIHDDALCLVDINRYDLIEQSGMIPDLVHKRSAHISAGWRFADKARVSIPMEGADLSAYRYLCFSVFAVNGAGGSFSLFLDSGNGDGSCGYEITLRIAHDGWNEYRIELPFMRAIRTPRGWDQIESICFDCVFGGQSNRMDTVLYFDSLFVRGESAPHLFESMPELKGAAAFAKNGGYAIVNRRRVALSIDGADASPFEMNGAWWIPMGAIASVMAYSAVADNKAYTLSFTYRRKKYAFEAGKSSMTVNGAAETLDFAPMEKGGVLFFPAEFVRDFFRWRQIFISPVGLIVFSNRKSIFDHVIDAHRIWQLIADMSFDRPSGDAIKEDLHKVIKNTRKGRVLLSQEELVALRKLAKTDANLKEYVIALKHSFGVGSSAFEAEPISDFLANDPDQLKKSSEALVAFATLYRVTGDKIYSERAAKEAEALATLAHWGSPSVKTIAETAFGMAIAYDWCHHTWSEARKSIVERSMLRNALRPGLEAYNGKLQTWDAGSAASAQINAGMLAASLALADVYPESTRRLLPLVLRNSEAFMQAFSPDGGFAEGVLAWECCARNAAFTVQMLKTACGRDYGFASLPGFLATGYFPIYAETENGAWNYNNALATAVDTSVLSLMAKLSQNATLARWRRRELLAGKKEVTPYDVLFFDAADELDESELPLDAVYRNAGLAMMRADWSGEGMTVCLHGGRNNDRDGDLDAGSFILECAGERFLVETGGDESLPMLLRRRAEGQNTVVINPTEQSVPDQNPGATAPLIEMKSAANRVYAVLDMTKTNDALLRAKRGVMLTEGRSVAVVQDELTLDAPGTVVWTAYTRAEVALNASGRAAKLTINEKTLLCRLCGVGSPARFTVEAIGDGGLSRISVRMEGKDRLRMAVVFRLMGEDDSISERHYEITPISKWAELSDVAEQ